MKGLLKNNWYAALSSVKTFTAAMAVTGIFTAIVISQPLLMGYVMLCIIGYSVISIFSLWKGSGSKWEKYKLTAPVRRIDIVKSHFISQLIWLFAGVAVSVLIIGFSVLLHGFPFDREIDLLSLLGLGISIGLLMNAFFFPLHEIGGEERNEVFLVISLVSAIGIVLGMVSFFNWLFGANMTVFQILVSIIAMTAFAAAAFLFSYLVTVLLFKKKEM